MNEGAIYHQHYDWNNSVPNTVECQLSERQISEPTFSSFYVQTTKNQCLLHAIKVFYFVCTVLHCNGNIIL